MFHERMNIASFQLQRMLTLFVAMPLRMASESEVFVVLALATTILGLGIPDAQKVSSLY